MILKHNFTSRVFLLFVFFFVSYLQADVIDTNVSNIVTINNNTLNKTQKKLQTLSGSNTKAVSGIKLNIADLNIGKNSALKIDYSPKLNHEGIFNIDNHREATVKFQYKF